MAEKSINKVVLLGRLGADPEIKYTQSGQAVSTLNVATNHNWKDDSGVWQTKTDWHPNNGNFYRTVPRPL